MTDNTAIPPKSISASKIDDHVYKVFPNDLNANKTVFGGMVMAMCDRLALVVAERHSGYVCVTASVDSFNFINPAKENDTLIFKASINRAWTSSMEIGIKVVAENSYTGETRHIVSAFFTMVAVNESGKPMPVPQLIIETEKEQERFCNAQIRREDRLATREKLYRIDK